MLTFEYSGKQYEGKFDYNAFFKANAKFSLEQNGQSLNNGAAMLYFRLKDNDITALADTISILLPNTVKYSVEEVGKSIELISENDADKIEALFDKFIEEFKTSGFFLTALRQQKRVAATQTKNLKELLTKETDERNTVAYQEQLSALEVITSYLKDVN